MIGIVPKSWFYKSSRINYARIRTYFLVYFSFSFKRMIYYLRELFRLILRKSTRNIIKLLKNRKTLKFGYLIFWAYGFLLYFLLRPYPSKDELVIDWSIYKIYIIFPILIYLMIIIATLFEFYKLMRRSSNIRLRFIIILPHLIIAPIFIQIITFYIF